MRIKRLAGMLVLLGLPLLVQGAMQVVVQVTGVEGAMRDNVVASLGIERQKADPKLTKALLRRLHRSALEEIRLALQPFGYYAPEIDARLSHQEGRWRARYRITPGEPVRVSELDLRLSGAGSSDATMQRAVKEFPLHKGAVLEHALYEQGKRRLQELAAQRGYFDARLLEHQIRVRVAERTASVILHLDTGPRYKFGPVSFHQDILRDSLLQRYPGFHAGQPYTTDKLLDLQGALSDSDYFERVEVLPQRDSAKDLEVPIDVELDPRKTQRYTLGAGYGTDTGTRASFSWKHRRINRRGHSLNINAKLSELGDSLSAQYQIPLRNPVTDKAIFSALADEEHTDSRDSKRLLLGGSKTHTFRNGWVRTFYLNYQDEDFQIGSQQEHARLLIPGVTWSRIRADDRVFTTRGSRLSLDLKTAAAGLGSDTSLIQGQLQAKVIRPFGTRGRLILRGAAAATWVDDFDLLPATLRFYAGGDQSVRGYAYESIGPKDSSGEVIGGRHLLVGSVEYERPVRDKWSAAVFYDTGSAFNDSLDSLKQGVGLGVRWHSPVGPVRVDIGFPVNDKDGGWRLHLNIGPDL